MDEREREKILWMDGGLVSPQEASVSALGRGLALGEGVFETLRCYGGRVFALEHHYRRLCDGAAVMGLSVPTLLEVDRAASEVLNAMNLVACDARLRMTLCSAMPSPGMDAVVGPQGEVNFIVSATPVAALPENPEPVGVVTVPFSRNPTSALAGVKSTSYGESSCALRFANERRAGEALLSDGRGNLSEGSASNVFVVDAGRLRTPPLTSGCLAGVTRALVIEACRQEGLVVEEGKIPMDSLEGMQEIFLTSSLREIQEVNAVNFTSLPEGREFTKRCRTSFQRLREELLGGEPKG